MAFVLAISCLGLGLSAWAPRESTEALLNRIRQKVAANLARLPNYTCLQTVERTVRKPRSRRFEPLDRVRLEVAYVGGRELFAWPGAARFEDRRIDEIVASGPIGSGDFALHARSVFLTKEPAFTHIAESDLDGRRTIRGDFQVPRSRSRFLMRSRPVAEFVGYHGSFWVDARTLDLVRLEVRADDIPAHLQVFAASDVMTYGRVRIGEADFLLPQSSELTMRDIDGLETRNRTQFSACRLYQGESVIRFGEDSPELGKAKPSVVALLPPEIFVEIALLTPVDETTAAIGDPLSARVKRDVRHGGVVVLPKGALLTGRITRLERRMARQGEFRVIGFDFFSAQYGNRRAEFRGTLENVFAGRDYFVAGGRSPAPWVQPTGQYRWSAEPQPGEGILFVRTGHLKIPAGLGMLWETR